MLPCVCEASQRTLKSGKEHQWHIRLSHRVRLFVLTTFHLWSYSVTKQTHGNMKSIVAMYYALVNQLLKKPYMCHIRWFKNSLSYNLLCHAHQLARHFSRIIVWTFNLRSSLKACVYTEAGFRSLQLSILYNYSRTDLYTTDDYHRTNKKRNVHIIITGSPQSLRVSSCKMWIVKTLNEFIEAIFPSRFGSQFFWLTDLPNYLLTHIWTAARGMIQCLWAERHLHISINGLQKTQETVHTHWWCSLFLCLR